MFKKNWQTIIGSILFVVAVVLLFIGGITKEQISGLLVAVFTAIAAVTGIWTIVWSWIKGKKSNATKE